MADFYALRATLSDGFTVDLDQLDYRDPCGIGVHVAQVAVVAVINGWHQ